MIFFQLLTALALLLAGSLQGETPRPDPGNRLAVVRGRIEIANPKLKVRGGGADASGVGVWLVPLKPQPNSEAVALPRRRIEQRDKRFIPHVTVIQVGTEIDFPNEDPFFHNVFSAYDGKTFDLGLYASGESRPVRFNRPGISYLYCNIHPQMSAVVVTVATPYFASSARGGGFSISNVPAGDYELHVWHERSDPQQLEAQRRILPVESPVTDLGVIRLDEAAYIPTAHKNKHGEEYPGAREWPAYRRP